MIDAEYISTWMNAWWRRESDRQILFQKSYILRVERVTFIRYGDELFQEQKNYG